MEFFILLSIQILLSGIPVMIFAKDRYQTKLRAIFWLIGLLTLSPTVINVFLTGKTYTGYFLVKVLTQTAFLEVNPVSAFFILVLTIFSIIFALHEIKIDTNTIKYQTKYCIYSTLLLVSVLLMFLLSNGMLYLLAASCTGFFGYKLITVQKDLPEIYHAGSKFLKLLFISGILITIPLMLLSALSGNLDFAGYLKVLSQNKNISNLSYIFVLLGFGLQIISALICKQNIKNIEQNTTILNMFFPIVALIACIGSIIRFVSISTVPDRLLSGILCITMGIVAILLTAISIYSNNKYKSFFKKLGSLFFDFTILNIALIGVAFNIPALAIIGTISFLILFINDILVSCMANLSVNKYTNNIQKAGLLASAYIPFSCGFIAVFGVLSAIVLTFFAKSCNIFIFLALLLIILYLVMKIFSTKLLLKLTPVIDTQPEDKLHALIFSHIPLLLSAFFGIFIFCTAKLVIVPASYIISGTKYYDIYVSLLNISGMLQTVLIIFAIITILCLIIRKLHIKTTKSE